MFSVLLVLRLPRLGKRELILVLFVCSVCACLDLSVSSSSWGLGRAAVGDCGTPWIFLIPFLQEISSVGNQEEVVPFLKEWPMEGRGVSPISLSLTSSYSTPTPFFLMPF